MKSVVPRTIAPSRRTVLRTATIGTAAWAAPAVVGVAAAPAVAASTDLQALQRPPAPTTPLPPSVGLGQVQFEAWVEGNRWAKGNFGVQLKGPANGTTTVLITLAGTSLHKPQTIDKSGVIGESTRFGQDYSFGAPPSGDYTVTITVTATVYEWWEWSGPTKVVHQGSWPLPTYTAQKTITVPKK